MYQNSEAKAKQYKYIKLLKADLNSNNVINKFNDIKTFANDQVWQNCYVEFTSTGFTTTITPLTFRVYYVNKQKN